MAVAPGAAGLESGRRACKEVKGLRAGYGHALRLAGLPRLAFRFHDLRHYAVSQLIAQGASILQVARVAGHADPSVTLRVYGHLIADGLAEAARRYDPLRAVAVDER